MWTNYHTHSQFCDGSAGLHAIVSAAQRLSMPAIGLSSHAPLPFQKRWSMKTENLRRYLGEIKTLKRKRVGIQVYTGLEVDYIPSQISPSDFVQLLDYTIGSIHFVDRLPDGSPWEIDSTLSAFKAGLSAIFSNNVRAAVSRYFELTREMIINGRPDIVGHLDKIKIHNRHYPFFRENEGWYRAEINETLDVIRHAGTIVEVNTRGIYTGKTDDVYPSRWILKLISEKSIPVTLSSDAHHPSELLNGFASAAPVLVESGIQTLMVLNDGIWKPSRYNDKGLVLPGTSAYAVA